MLNTENSGGVVSFDGAVSLLRANRVVAIPTETVYGLAANAWSSDAVAEIYKIKQRPLDNPLIVHVSSLAQAQGIGSLNTIELTLAERFWPGPLTLILPLRASLPKGVSAGLSTVAIRMPGHEVALELIRAVGDPLVAPSANPSGRPSPTTAEHVLADYGGAVPVLDGGATSIGVESTVVRIVDSECMILRPGMITALDLEDFGLDVLQHKPMQEHLLHSPGTRYRHYAPSIPVRLFATAQELEHAANTASRVYILSATAPYPNAEWNLLTERTLYAELRKAELLEVEEILVLCAGSVRSNAALMDRLTRAAGSHQHNEGT